MPNRARSKRPDVVAIISIAQHASPKVAGHSDPLRAYPARPSTVSVKIRWGGAFLRDPYPTLFSRNSCGVTGFV